MKTPVGKAFEAKLIKAISNSTNVKSFKDVEKIVSLILPEIDKYADEISLRNMLLFDKWKFENNWEAVQIVDTHLGEEILFRQDATNYMASQTDLYIWYKKEEANG